MQNLCHGNIYVTKGVHAQCPNIIFGCRNGDRYKIASPILRRSLSAFTIAYAVDMPQTVHLDFCTGRQRLLPCPVNAYFQPSTLTEAGRRVGRPSVVTLFAQLLALDAFASCCDDGRNYGLITTNAALCHCSLYGLGCLDAGQGDPVYTINGQYWAPVILSGWEGMCFH